MSQEAIGVLFETRMKNWAAAKDYPVKFQNQDFDPSTEAVDGIYLEFAILPGRTGSQTQDGAHRSYVGVVQINIRCKRGAGPAVDRRIAGELDAIFPNALRLANATGFWVQIMSPASPAPGLEDSRGYFVPVSFNYRADA